MLDGDLHRAMASMRNDSARRDDLLRRARELISHADPDETMWLHRANVWLVDVGRELGDGK